MKNSKFFIYIFLVLAIVIIVDLLVSTMIEKKMQDSYNLKIQSTHTVDSEIAIVGASRASHHFIPRMLEDSLGMSTYNYGIDGRNIYVHYAVVKSILANSRKKPEIIILDLSNVDIFDLPGYNKERLNVLYPYFKDSVAHEVLADLLDKEELAVISLSGLYRHNSNLFLYARDQLASGNDSLKGYVPLYNVWNKEKGVKEASKEKIDAEKVEYLEKLIEEGKKEGINFVLVTSPTYAHNKDNRWTDKIKEIANKENVKYLNFENDSVFMAHIDWFSDPDHLNDTGAKELTIKLIDVLKTLKNTKK